MPFQLRKKVGTYFSIIVLVVGVIAVTALVKNKQIFKTKAFTDPVDLVFEQVQLQGSSGQLNQPVTILLKTNGHMVSAAEVRLRIANPAVAKIRNIVIPSSNTSLNKVLPTGSGLTFSDNTALIRLGVTCTTSSSRNCSATTNNTVLATVYLDLLTNGTTSLTIESTSKIAVIGETVDASAGGIKFALPINVSSTNMSGDANGDEKVDNLDYQIWLQNYGQSITGRQNGDFSQNGKVDGIDYVIWVVSNTTVSIPTNSPTPTVGEGGGSITQTPTGKEN